MWKEVTILTGIFDSDHQEELRLNVSQWGSEGHVWHAGNLLGHFFLYLSDQL